jgi:hypothetical protein
MELTSETHRLTQTENTGEFEVWPVEKRQLHVTEYRDGRKVREEVDPPDEATKTLLAHANSVPLFAANFAGDGRFNIDLDCGFQRWSGTKSEREVRSALRKCGFSNPQIKAVVKSAKVQEHGYVRRY